jgi:hypothetical protein
MFKFAFKRSLCHGGTSIVSCVGNSASLCIEFLDKNDNHHRLNGPAIIGTNGHRSWYINGQYFTEERYIDYIKFMNLVKENYVK